ncbi:MAG TPA: orotate phosphoribosyltransferase [Spirochaetota bacterium]|nr:orotate phosphoribosyltransferase [Spirochaetota bacterium]HOM38760.1 orotate phosphoribosyltransferase [Spirochaetota bacterium]HPQ49558.1 orotate phosphoribosyltransferase [Spirochaetota bacterium]
MEDKKKLLNYIAKNSFKYSEEPIFKLQSGKMSNYYINLKVTTLNPQTLWIIGKLVYEILKDKDIEAVGGLTLGADPIAIATSLYAINQGKNIYPFIVRKEAKSHGTKKLIECAFENKPSVFVIDDVITTGGSTIKAIESCITEGFNVKGVVCIVDRMEGGKENIENNYKIPVFSLFTKEDIFQEYKKN